MTDYLTFVEVLAIHDDQIATYGGANGLRDAGQLESALFRPQTGHYADLLAEAAALWESLSQIHAFIDGNKLTAFAATFTVLAINSVEVIANADEAWTFLSDLYGGHGLRFDALDGWLRANTRSR